MTTAVQEPISDLRAILLPVIEVMQPTIKFEDRETTALEAHIFDSPNRIHLADIRVLGTILECTTWTGGRKTWELCDKEEFEPTEAFLAITGFLFSAYVDQTHQRLCKIEKSLWNIKNGLSGISIDVPSR
jgi:hypothetical protein